ncbi:MAG: hypothetical protein Ta2E_00750 [Mycoplasmoidaceae bacterium]|nr:MAG: hypothetical protein Ta2E_00750 [Mycoplasmoidaceae bacterium]
MDVSDYQIISLKHLKKFDAREQSLAYPNEYPIEKFGVLLLSDQQVSNSNPRDTTFRPPEKNSSTQK